jgi:GntR family transcriptional regulator/MocR family aminotransferase
MSWSEIFPWERPGAGAPVVRHVHGQVRAAIHAGALGPGARLPATRVLAARIGVARASVVAAYDLLLAEGYAVGRRGAGTFVAADLTGVVDEIDGGETAATADCARPGRVGALEALAWPADEILPRPFTAGRTLMDAHARNAWRRSTRRALKELEPIHFGYTDPRGEAALREQIRDYLRAARGVVCDSDQVIITAGTQHGVDLAARLLLSPGDAVCLEDPGYPPTYHTLAAVGARIIPTPVDGAGLVIGEGFGRASAARMAVLTPSHQYPLGVTMSLGRRLDLLQWAREAGAWVIEDDYASEFRYSGPPLRSLQGLDGGERVIYLGTLNKTLFPGLRMGFLVAPRSLAPALAAARQLIDRQPSTITQAIVLDFMQSGQFASHIRRRRLAYRQQRDALVGALRDRLAQALEVEAPDQGMHLIAFLREGFSDAAVEAAAREAGVATRAISGFYREAAPRQGLLLGFSGYPATAMRPAVERLAAAIARFPPKRELVGRSGSAQTFDSRASSSRSDDAI